MSKKKLKAKPRAIPEVLAEEEQAQLLSLLPSGSLLQRRNLLMVRLMLNAGLRSQEVCDLKPGHFNPASGKLKVHGKGKRQRIVWLDERDRADLELFVRYSGRTPFEPIFQTGMGNKIQTRFLRALLERLGQQMGKRLHPHLLRHTFATDLLRKTKNLPLVQKALGHSDIGTTQIYLHIQDDELETAMKELRK